MSKLRIIKRTNLDGTVEFVIQKRFVFWWRDADPTGYLKDSFYTLDEAKESLKWFDGSKPTGEVVYEDKVI